MAAVRRDGRTIYVNGHAGGLPSAKMVVRTAQRLGETSSGVPTIQHARSDQGPGRMETRLRCAQPAKNGQYDGCISVPKRRLLQRSDRNVIKSAASLAVPG